MTVLSQSILMCALQLVAYLMVWCIASMAGYYHAEKVNLAKRLSRRSRKLTLVASPSSFVEPMADAARTKYGIKWSKRPGSRKFCVISSPYLRICTAYLQQPQAVMTAADLNAFVIRFLSKKYSRNMSQLQMALRCDHWLRQENLPEDFDDLMRKNGSLLRWCDLDCEAEYASQMKQLTTLMNLLDDKSTALIDWHCRGDFDILGYPMLIDASTESKQQ